MNYTKYILIALLLFLGVFTTKGQSLGTTSSKHFEIGAYYPMIIGDKLENRFNGIYDGVIGVDFKYTIKKLPFINLKVGSSFDFLKFDKTHMLKGLPLD